MTALVAGFLLIGYLLAPGVVYRLAFSSYIPAKRYQRTRTEEVVFSLLVTVLPFLLSWLLLHTPIGPLGDLTIGGSKGAAYHAIFESLLPGKDLSRELLGAAYIRGFLEQARFIFLLWLLCGLEGWICGRLVASYGDYSPDSLRTKFCDQFLLSYVSEWEILFTALALPTAESQVEIEVDALSTMDVLYRGRLVDWFLDQDGKLEGIFLEDAWRYERDDLERDRNNDVEKPKDSYWRVIPGAKLYLVASTIANYNIRYVQPEARPSVDQVRQKLGLGEEAIITALPPAPTPAPSPHPSQSKSQ
jgi:hypothetical protein